MADPETLAVPRTGQCEWACGQRNTVTDTRLLEIDDCECAWSVLVVEVISGKLRYIGLRTSGRKDDSHGLSTDRNAANTAGQLQVDDTQGLSPLGGYVGPLAVAGESDVARFLVDLDLRDWLFGLLLPQTDRISVLVDCADEAFIR